jgi:hypothetical protein
LSLDAGICGDLQDGPWYAGLIEQQGHKLAPVAWRGAIRASVRSQNGDDLRNGYPVLRYGIANDTCEMRSINASLCEVLDGAQWCGDREAIGQRPVSVLDGSTMDANVVTTALAPYGGSEVEHVWGDVPELMDSGGRAMGNHLGRASGYAVGSGAAAIKREPCFS